MKDPAFLFYSKDWLTGTSEYMPDEKGVYIDLLCYQHQNGSLPSDMNRLSKMVGISTDEFKKIWSVISKHFEPIGQPNGEPNGNRLVNRKLNEVMGERSEKGKMNTITGTFAALLRTGKYDEKTYKELKSAFNASDFMIYEKERISERLTEWLHNRLKSIGNGNANEDVVEDVIEIKEEYAQISILNFDEFWELYDKKVGDKTKLRKKFETIKEPDREKIKEHIPLYRMATPDKKYRKDPQTYLNNQSWNDEIIQSNGTGRKNHSAVPSEQEQLELAAVVYKHFGGSQ